MRDEQLQQPRALPGFRRRLYRGFGPFWDDLRRLWGLLRLRSGPRQRLPASFQERLMLTVTGVNRCRFCSFAHSRAALESGVPPEEIARLLSGELEQSPPAEVLALLYAQHWAETDGRPSPAARARLLAAYPTGLVQSIDLGLQMIRMGNLLGNTADFLLARLSGGRFGLEPDERR